MGVKLASVCDAARRSTLSRVFMEFTMFARRYALSLVLLVVLPVGAFAETLKGTAEARELTDKVMQKVGEGNMEGGLLLMKPFLIIPVAEYDVMVDRLKMQMPAMAQRFGKSIGHEFIREDKTGENLYRVVQINRFEHHPMRWVFYFYRGMDGWVLNSFKTDDEITKLFPEG